MTEDVKKAIEARDHLLEEAESIELEAAGCLDEMTVPQLKDAVTMLVGIRRLNKEIDSTFDDIIATAYKAHKTATGRKKKFAAPLTAAENIIKGKIKEYYKEEGIQQSKEYLELVDEACESAEMVRTAELKGLRATGLGDQADALQESPLPIAPVPKPAPTEVEGISVSSLWSAEVFDEVALIGFIHNNPQWAHLLSIDMKELNTLARMQKDAMSLPGARAVVKQSVSIRLPAATE